jgi:hypothetical protein
MSGGKLTAGRKLMSSLVEITVELDGHWASWEAYQTDYLGEEHVLGKDVLHYHEVPENTIGDMARVVDVLEAIQLGLADGIPQHFTVDVINRNPDVRCGELNLTEDRRVSAMLADNGLEIPES